METLIQDIRFALRVLRKNPGFALVAVLVLAIGIGANTAIFSVVDTVLLRPLPYPHAERLVFVENVFKQAGHTPMTYTNFQFWRDQHQLFDQVVTYFSSIGAMTGLQEPEEVPIVRISANLLPTLGVSPIAGRGFRDDEEPKSADRVVMLTESFWHKHYGGSASAVGQKLTLNDSVYTIVGVVPDSFRLGHPFELVMPLRLTPDINIAFLPGIARLQPGVSLKQAQAALPGLIPAYKKADPELDNVAITPYQQVLVGNSRPLLFVLLGGVIAVLLIACANTANLLLARAAVREKEIALRISLGAGRIRLARQLLTESVLLSLIGGVLGILMGWGSLHFLTSLLQKRLPQTIAIQLDGRILLFALLLSLATGLVFGMAPVVQLIRGNLHDRLKQGGRQTAGGGQRLRQVLVVGEIAISLVLLAAAGLLLRSMVSLLNVDKGFNSHHVITMAVRPSPVRYKDPKTEILYLQRILESVSSLPGVQSAGWVYTLPLTGNSTNGGIKIEGHPGDSPNVDKQYVEGNYFQAMSTPLLKGRFFDSRDNLNSPRVVIVNQTLAQKVFPNQDPIGKRIDVGWGDPGFSEIIGVVADAKQEALTAEHRASTFMLYSQNAALMEYLDTNLVVRTSQDPLSAVAAIRSRIQQLDPNQPLADVKTMDDVLAESLAPQRAPAWLFGGFSAIALFLAAIGIYGVLSYFVVQRSQEIGVRMALGAQRSNVLGLILGQGARLIGIGVAIGIVGGVWAARALTSLLFGVKSTDLPTFIAVSLLLASLALVACAVPALRATRVDPLVALRSE
ncbi:MAG TPA: ABC transporter permease [Candidatus Angelobacter sp.]|nr:ABC transporter permease [Candidatus Angelobacter sp.]